MLGQNTKSEMLHFFVLRLPSELRAPNRAKHTHAAKDKMIAIADDVAADVLLQWLRLEQSVVNIKPVSRL